MSIGEVRSAPEKGSDAFVLEHSPMSYNTYLKLLGENTQEKLEIDGYTPDPEGYSRAVDVYRRSLGGRAMEQTVDASFQFPSSHKASFPSLEEFN